MATAVTNNENVPGVWRGYASVTLRGENIQEQIVTYRSDHDWAVTNLSEEDVYRVDCECTLKITKQHDAAFREEQKRLGSLNVNPGQTERYPDFGQDIIVDFLPNPGTYFVEGYSLAEVFKGNDRIGEVETRPHATDEFVVN